MSTLSGIILTIIIAAVAPQIMAAAMWAIFTPIGYVLNWCDPQWRSHRRYMKGIK